MKDWVSFGHRFKDRLGDPACPTQRSPVFHQFLDCVWQIMQQFPDAFEFTSSYMTRIAEHVNSGWFGNFLSNSMREREQENIMRSTVSLWAHLDAMRDTFINKTYKFTKEVLLPVCSLRRLQIWFDYYLRFDELHFASTAETLEDIEDQNAEEILKAAHTVVWVPDDRVQECHDCKQKFTGIRRKHHCRACGQIFCAGCTRRRIRLPFLGYQHPERVCDTCYTSVSRGGSGDEDEFEVISDPADLDLPLTCF